MGVGEFRSEDGSELSAHAHTQTTLAAPEAEAKDAPSLIHTQVQHNCVFSVIRPNGL